MTYPLGTLVHTGQHCPVSGVWQAQMAPFGTAPIAIHNVMPPYHGVAVRWKLIRFA